jgi:hypothetical protein
MKSHIEQMLASVLPEAPPDLVAFYSGERPTQPSLRVNFLPLEGAIAYTQALHSSPVPKRLGVFALDDANDSNPYCYIARGPARGMILHLSHDPEPEIKFPTINSFLQAVRDLVAENEDIDCLSPSANLAPSDPQLLEREILALLADDTEDNTFLLCLYIPLLDSSRSDLFRQLCEHPDFFVREATARYIAKQPATDLRAIGEALAGDQHPQVARAGAAAVNAIRRIGNNSV